MRIEITHHIAAGKGWRKPYLAFLSADGRGGIARRFVKHSKAGRNRKIFSAALQSGDVIEFRYRYWSDKSRTELVRANNKVGLAYATHPDGGTRWLAVIGPHLRAVTRDEAMALASRPRLAGEISEVELPPALRGAKPMWAGVRFLGGEDVA